MVKIFQTAKKSVINASAGAVFTIPININAKFCETEEIEMAHGKPKRIDPRKKPYPILKVAEEVTSYPPRIYILEGQLEKTYPKFDKNVARVIESVYGRQ